MSIKQMIELHIARPGSDIHIVIPVQQIAANILDELIVEAPTIEAVRNKRQDDLEQRMAEMISLHVQEAILEAHKKQSNKPLFQLTGAVEYDGIPYLRKDEFKPNLQAR